ASSNRPMRRSMAPVNAPLTCPNSSLSTRPAEIALQFTFTSGRSFRALAAWIARATSSLDALGGITSFSYDPNGNVLTVTDARGNMTHNTYEQMDRLASRTDPVGATETFAYDLGGNLSRHVDRKGQAATYTYDLLNRRTSGLYADGTSASFVFDAAGRLAA